jgi:uncharacterized protein
VARSRTATGDAQLRLPVRGGLSARHAGCIEAPVLIDAPAERVENGDSSGRPSGPRHEEIRAGRPLAGAAAPIASTNSSSRRRFTLSSSCSRLAAGSPLRCAVPMRLQSLDRWLLPREDHFYDMLEELGRLAHDAAVALARFDSRPATEVRENVQIIEHAADDVVRRMEESLAKTFVTPIDREDLHRLTSELDDIVDLANLTARAFTLYHIERPTEPMRELMQKLVTVTGMIRDAVPKLRAHAYAQLIDSGRAVRQVEKEADVIYRSAISSLFREKHDDFRLLLSHKEALDDLEHAVDHCDNVADLLTNLAVKHG